MTWTGKWCSMAALLGLVACSSGGSVGSAGPTDGEDPPMSQETPPQNVAAPALSAHSPPLNPESPPAGGALSSSDDTCAELCSVLRSAGCEVPDCVASCSDSSDLETLSLCPAELIALVRCFVAQPEFQCSEVSLEGELPDEISEACSAEAIAYVRCAGLDTFETEGQNGPPGSGAICTLEGDQCAGCPDECSACYCATPASSAEVVCASLCGTGGA